MAVRFTEHAPPAHLAGLVARAWTLEAGPVAPGPWRVVPDGAIDVVRIDGGAPELAGPATHATLSDLPAGAVVRGWRLRPGATQALLGLPAHALLDATVALGELHAPRPRHGADRLVEHALALLARPGARTAGLAAELGLSERQLLRRFRAAVGLGPAATRRVLRLQRALALAATAPIELAELAAEAGYADQAHMTNDWVELCGLPPAALLRDRQVELASGG